MTLKPCPFCGSQHVSVIEIVTGGGGYDFSKCAVLCGVCLCYGPPSDWFHKTLTDKKASASMKWNFRMETK